MVFKWLQNKFPRWNRNILNRTPSATTTTSSSSRSISKASNNQPRKAQAESDSSPKDKNSLPSSFDLGNSSHKPSTSRSSSTNTTSSLQQEHSSASCTKTEELLKGRLSVKVFPSQRAAAAAAAATAQAQASQVQQHPALAARNVKVKRVKYLFSMFRTPSPSKWKWRCSCYSYQQNSSHVKRVSFRKFLVKFQNKAWFTCPLDSSNNNSSPSLPGAALVQAAARQQGQPNRHDQQTVESLKRSLAPPHSPRKLSLDTLDPEYWIKTDSDYVVLEVSNDTGTKKNGDGNLRL